MIRTTSLKTRIGILAATVATMAAVAAPAQASFGLPNFVVSAALTQNQGVDSARAGALALLPATPEIAGPAQVEAGTLRPATPEIAGPAQVEAGTLRPATPEIAGPAHVEAGTISRASD